jgi:hypothetical protein
MELLNISFSSFVHVRCQGTNGPGLIGRLGRPIRVKIESSLRGKESSLYKEGGVSMKASKRLEGKPFSLAGHGRSPAVGVPCAPRTLAAATTLGVNM